ncbi:ABC transporter ATP-binding protein [Ferrovibrio xuzhouensis]|uniref:ABC transporter ATP-binding protein n=1 Tax=Ferrovibrio xuzhouensis TaxID=1576914 RepID=A0ABV7VNF3_9PROT
MNPLLAVNGLSVHFTGLKAVEDVSFEVASGSIVGLIGPNGAGKTTLLNCLSRILNPTYGAVEYDGHDLLGRPVHRLSEIGVTRTFQNLELFGEGTVLENVVVGCFPRFRSNMISELLSLPSANRARRAAYEEARQLIEELGLLPHIDTVVSGLPYGVQKSVELARALAGKPKLLLLDEPAAGMNPEESRQLGETIRGLRDKRGITVLLVEHDMRLVMGVCENIVVLVQGAKVCEGPPQVVRGNSMVIKAYLGEEEAEDA